PEELTLFLSHELALSLSRAISQGDTVCAARMAVALARRQAELSVSLRDSEGGADIRSVTVTLPVTPVTLTLPPVTLPPVTLTLPSVTPTLPPVTPTLPPVTLPLPPVWTGTLPV
uniref:HOIL-1/Sharpin LUBAC thetering domain-containing protein n=1 Tax=Catharus ustulatus TaxID=91951 RepID=A0A8C3UJZ1_CATUS